MEDSLTIPLPRDLGTKIREFGSVDWARVARQAISEKARQLSFAKDFTSESEFSHDDALRLGREVSRAVSRKVRGV